MRIVVEKPFGVDLDSSRHATATLARWFDETQIFRIDHYLGKETVQNLLVFRFANLLFESSWHRDRIAAVQVTVAEDGGVGTRGRYYDESGAVRDILQNHLTQLLALIAMEPPVRLGANEIRDEKVKLLRAIWPVDPDSAVLGQYEPGEVGGVPVPGYAEEVGNPGSRTPTFVAVAFTIDTWRWQGVPFYLRTGKRLPRRVTEIDVIFRPPPVCLFDESGACQVHGNVLRITLQPDEGFELRFDVKRPGDEMIARDPRPPLRLRGGIRPDAGGVRDPALRRGGGGADPLRAHRRGGGGLADLGPAALRRTSRSIPTRRGVSAQSRPMPSHTAGATTGRFAENSRVGSTADG